MGKPFLVVAVLNRMVRESFFTEGTLSVFAEMSETGRSEGKVLQVEGTASTKALRQDPAWCVGQ